MPFPRTPWRTICIFNYAEIISTFHTNEVNVLLLSSKQHTFRGTPVWRARYAWRANTHRGFPPTKIAPVSGGRLCKPLSAEHPCTDCSCTENTIRFPDRQEPFFPWRSEFTLRLFLHLGLRTTHYALSVFTSWRSAVTLKAEFTLPSVLFYLLAVRCYTVAVFTLTRFYSNYRRACAKPLL